LEDYLCPLWKINDENIKGSFDESGYEIGHITEFSINNNDNINNLQALCKSCNIVKTKRFLNKEINDW
jgi:5-methylcytosine-specific restriction endonuclease McrA